MTRLSIGGKARKGVNLSQARSQVAAVSGYLTPRSEAEKSVRPCQAASSLGAVQVGLESGGDLLAVPVGHEPHPGARNRVVPAQVWTVAWGQDRLCSPLGQARRARRTAPARFAPVREVPPLRSARRSRLCCAGTGAHEPPFKEAPSSPWTQIPSTCLGPVHARPRPRCGPSGRRPGGRARTLTRIASR